MSSWANDQDRRERLARARGKRMASERNKANASSMTAPVFTELREDYLRLQKTVVAEHDRAEAAEAALTALTEDNARLQERVAELERLLDQLGATYPRAALTFGSSNDAKGN